jgi:flagellar protein FliS
MSYHNPAQQYVDADVLSRSPEWLVPLLYEHLLASLRRASVQIETGDLEGKAESVSKAQAIILELAGTLDTERGGEVAVHLSSLYAFFASELVQVSRTLDVRTLQRLTTMIADLHGAWVRAAEEVAPRGRAGARPLGSLSA